MSFGPDRTVLNRYGHAVFTRDMYRSLMDAAMEAPSWSTEAACGPLSLGVRGWSIEAFADGLRVGKIDEARMIETLEYLLSERERIEWLQDELGALERALDGFYRARELTADQVELAANLARDDRELRLVRESLHAFTGPRPTAWEHLLKSER